MIHYDVIIIGAGAAGLMCAFTAAQRGKKVLLIERSNKVGKKILMSGGGRCNFTNLFTEPTNFISTNPHFCKSALSQYNQWDFIQLVEKHHIAYHEKTHGQLFCDQSSKDILNMLLHECNEAKVEIKTHSQIEQTRKTETGYAVISDTGTYSCNSLVIASGGLSIPKLGGSDYGYQIARQFSIPVIPPRAALVPLTFGDPYLSIFSTLSGLSIDANVSVNNTSFKEAILFTHRGLSGPAILQASSYWQLSEPVNLNLLPNTNVEEKLLGSKQAHPKSLLRTQLSTLLPKALVIQLENLWWLELRETALSDWKNSKLKSIAEKIECWQISPSGTEGYRTAEVTLGGVDTHHLSSKTMESNKHRGLYFIGEVVDVTGHLGGFNFQWAWSSGYVAGRNVN